jgi:hypothetical protein
MGQPLLFRGLQIQQASQSQQLRKRSNFLVAVVCAHGGNDHLCFGASDQARRLVMFRRHQLGILAPLHIHTALTDAEECFIARV